MKHLIIFLLLAAFPARATIIGEPRIRCAPTGITVFMETDSPFKGALFLKGSADRKSCKADFSQRPSQNISFEFDFDQCPSRRKRQIAPQRGMTMSSVLVVSYHGSIITHRDVAFQIDCFYREENSRVETLLNVTAPQPKVLSDQPKLPTCDYRVEVAGGGVSSGGGGASVVTVGESVVHIWSCSGDAPSDVYCMQVYNCSADDGESDHVQVVDSNGCTIDGELLSPIRYKGGAMRAAASSQAFKFADKHVVYFKCSIRMTVKNPLEQCPIQNCAPSGSGSVSLSRQSRSLTHSEPPLTIFHRKFSKNPTEFNIFVTSGELIVEAEGPRNHLMSTYNPLKYSYPMTTENVPSTSSASFIPIFLVISIVFLLF